MDNVVDELVSRLLEQTAAASSTGRRVLVGLCGVPGSGKSQLAAHVNRKLNEKAQAEVGIVVGLDGWHLTRAQLEAMPDPQLARDKRGAAWTFDGKAYADFVTRLRTSEEGTELKAPSFSHSLKDPVSDDISISPSHRIVILEGLYSNVNEGEWARAAAQYDQRWVIECDAAIAKARLILRHVATGVGKDEAEAEWRVDNNDAPNGQYLLQHVFEPALRIRSIDDTLWKGAE